MSAAEANDVATQPMPVPFTAGRVKLNERNSITQLGIAYKRKPSLVGCCARKLRASRSAYDARTRTSDLELAKLYQAAEHRQRDAP